MNRLRGQSDVIQLLYFHYEREKFVKFVNISQATVQYVIEDIKKLSVEIEKILSNKYTQFI